MRSRHPSRDKVTHVGDDITILDMTACIRSMGAWFLSLLKELGQMFIFLVNAVYIVFRPPFKFNMLMRQIRFLGSKSMVVILLTGSFTGMVLSLQRDTESAIDIESLISKYVFGKI